MQIIYNLLVIPLLYLGFRCGALFNAKIRRGIAGRKNLFAQLQQDLQHIKKNRVWFHVASYGEFEQSKPVLKKLKAAHPDLFLIITFFSPSAYEHIKQAPPVDYICYLPFDSVFNAQKFIAIVAPTLAVIVRHDIWPNFVWALCNKKIPLILINASIPGNSSRLWPVFRFFNKRLYQSFDHILVISGDEFERIGSLLSDRSKLLITGDTKFDQVYQRALEHGKIDDLIQRPFLQNKRIWVVGSSWREDEARVIPAYAKLLSQYHDLFLIIIPHEPSPQRVREIEQQLNQYQMSAITYSRLTAASADCKALIVDKMGFLANIYGLGFVAFVGGSYEQNVHNVLEPAAHGIPVLFGPKIQTQPEAMILVQNSGGFIVRTSEEIISRITAFIENKQIATRAGENARQVIMKHSGATEKTVQLLSTYVKD